jgi:hypothetical protein
MSSGSFTHQTKRFESAALRRDLIKIRARLRVVARVKTGRGLGHVQDGDARGQPVVQFAQNLGGAQRGRLAANFQMSHLAHGVDPGIGAPGALQLHVASKQLLDGLLQLALHGPGVDLLLPAGETRAVVFQRQAKRLHRLSTRKAPRPPPAADDPRRS